MTSSGDQASWTLELPVRYRVLLVAGPVAALVACVVGLRIGSLLLGMGLPLVILLLAWLVRRVTVRVDATGVHWRDGMRTHGWDWSEIERIAVLRHGITSSIWVLHNERFMDDLPVLVESGRRGHDELARICARLDALRPGGSPAPGEQCSVRIKGARRTRSGWGIRGGWAVLRIDDDSVAWLSASDEGVPLGWISPKWSLANVERIRRRLVDATES